MQGFLFGHPLTPERLTPLFGRHYVETSAPSRGVGAPTPDRPPFAST
jgi:hypothetical protein